MHLRKCAQMYVCTDACTHTHTHTHTHTLVQIGTAGSTHRFVVASSEKDNMEAFFAKVKDKL